MVSRIGSGLAIAVVLAAGSATAQSALRTEDLVGRWGVASFFNPAQSAQVIAAARGACAQPYVVNRGRNGGAVMFEAFEGRPREVVVRGNRIEAMEDPSPQTSKQILSWDGRMLQFRYAEGEAATKYGTMVFVRCGR
jgi:hypothetical protein